MITYYLYRFLLTIQKFSNKFYYQVANFNKLDKKQI